MVEQLYALLDGLMAHVAIAAEYLAANQRVLNLILVVSTVCLAMIAIAAYVRTRSDEDPHGLRVADRRSGNGLRLAGEPRFAETERERPPVTPILTPAPPAPAAESPDDTGHRLSRLEESFLQLNRDMMRIDEIAKDLRQELQTLDVRLAAARQERPAEASVAVVEPEPVVGTALELVSARRADLIGIDSYNSIMNTLSDTVRRVDELNSMLESQRRTLLAVGQVLAQLPDWRKFRSSIVESLEDLVTVAENGSNRPR